jgi:hypothetical protein
VYSYSSTTGSYGSICAADAASCTGTSPAAVCTAGACGTCGKVGQPCCLNTTSSYICTASNSYCLYDSVTAMRTCQACGGMGQPCCSATSAAAGTGTAGQCNSPLTCKITATATTYTCQ